MIKKLRRKFIGMNMAIITIILAAILCTIVHLTTQNLERNSMQTLHELAAAPPGEKRPDIQQKLHQPYLLLRLDPDGNVIETEDRHFPLSGSDKAAHLIQAASAVILEHPAKTAPAGEPAYAEAFGTLPDEQLRFVRMTHPQGSCFVFVDISGEQSMRASLIRSCVLIGIGGFLLFFLINLLFARWAVKPVENAWNEQKQFVSDASHELKTPLAVILTNAELLQSPTYSTDDKNRFSDNILTMSDQMRTLVEGLLELSRADNGSMQLTMEHMNLRTFIERELCVFEPLYFEHTLTLRCELADDVWINGSPAHLKQVLDILLDNALKYGDPDSEVLVRLEKQHHHCLLSVTSHGQTIAPADLRRIFQRFYRIDQSRSRSGSYGLGLSIAEGIVRKHHGKIWAESTDGRNTFFVQLKASSDKHQRTSC